MCRGPGAPMDQSNVPLAHSIMGQVIMILIANNWNPTSFDAWESPNKERFVLNIENIQGISIFINSIISPIQLADLALASFHYSSSGMQHGIDWRKSMALHRKLVYNGAPNGVLGALECFLTGAMWPKARICQYGVGAACPHCGQMQSLLHLLWSCPHTRQLKHKYISATNELVAVAEQDPERLCFWTRGLIPLALIKIFPSDVPLDAYRLTFCTSREQLPLLTDNWPSGEYFGDGNGGRFTSHPGSEGAEWDMLSPRLQGYFQCLNTSTRPCSNCGQGRALCTVRSN